LKHVEVFLDTIAC